MSMVMIDEKQSDGVFQRITPAPIKFDVLPRVGEYVLFRNNVVCEVLLVMHPAEDQQWDAYLVVRAIGTQEEVISRI